MKSDTSLICFFKLLSLVQRIYNTDLACVPGCSLYKLASSESVNTNFRILTSTVWKFFFVHFNQSCFCPEMFQLEPIAKITSSISLHKLLSIIFSRQFRQQPQQILPQRKIKFIMLVSETRCFNFPNSNHTSFSVGLK